MHTIEQSLLQNPAFSTVFTQVIVARRQSSYTGGFKQNQEINIKHIELIHADMCFANIMGEKSMTCVTSCPFSQPVACVQAAYDAY